MSAITPNRLWVGLFLVAALAFAACATGAMDCAVGKPIGLSAALGAAFVSLFDTGAPRNEGAEERVEERTEA